MSGFSGNAPWILRFWPVIPGLRDASASKNGKIFDRSSRPLEAKFKTKKNIAGYLNLMSTPTSKCGADHIWLNECLGI